jgi:hypothetical protein
MPSFGEKANNPTFPKSALLAASTARNSFSEAMLTCGDPSDIAAQTDASTIHAGSSRDILAGASTCTTWLAPRPARRINANRLP